VLPLCPVDHRCATPGKIPLDVATGFHRATWQRQGVPTTDELDTWLASPVVDRLGIGMVLGRHVRIDVEDDIGFRILSEWSHGDLPATWEFTTRSGAYAWLYEAPEGLTLQKVVGSGEGQHSGIELLGLGQQTAIPP